MNTQTQEALKMAIDLLEDDLMDLVYEQDTEFKSKYAGGYKPERLKYAAELIVRGKEVIQACKEALAQPAQEPVLNVVKILNEFPLLDDEGLDEDKHHCEWAIQQDRKRLHAMIKNTHPAPHPAQEPVAWIEVTTHHEKYQTSKVILLDKGIKLPHDTLLYTHPAPSCQECENLKHDLEGYMDANKALINRKWQGLTSEEIRNLDLDNDVISVIFQTEKLLKEKNHG